MLAQIWAGFLLDLIIGDPKSIPHPVVIIGKGIEKLEKLLRSFIAPWAGEKAAGVLLTILIVGGTYSLVSLLLLAAGLIHPWVAVVLQTLIISSSLAVKGLVEVAKAVFDLLVKNDLAGAREKVGWLVGRDTAQMDEAEITRGTIESVAENFVDGIVSPLFYAFIGGAPLAMAYKAVNTLDSMVGYKNEKYMNFGWASAKFDDLANYVPARLSGFLLLAVTFFTRRNVRKAYYIMNRDYLKHPSPNGGIPEAAVAGVLGVRLGGYNVYGGEKSFRAYLGDPLYSLEPKKILESVELIYLSSFIGLVFGTSVYLLVAQLTTVN